MHWQDRIVIDPHVLTGKPVIKGTRIAVELIVELLSQGWTVEQITQNYSFSIDDIRAALQYASELLKHEQVFPFPPDISG